VVPKGVVARQKRPSERLSLWRHSVLRESRAGGMPFLRGGTRMNCPHCSAEMGEPAADWIPLLCPDCTLAGPRDVLEKLGARIADLEAQRDAQTSRAWLEDRIVDLEQQLEAERDRRIEAERPATILAEAERLLRELEVHMVAIIAGGVTLWGRLRRKIHSRGTLADAVARLEKEQSNG
jgi:hypothetical protein